MQQPHIIGQPTPAFIWASWAVLGIGIIAFLLGLWNAEMALNEKGYYFAVLCLGLYSAVSLQKAVRDQAEGIPTSSLYMSISWAALAISVILITVGLWHATLSLSEKGFYSVTFVMTLFSVITIQKNIRDVENSRKILNKSMVDFEKEEIV